MKFFLYIISLSLISYSAYSADLYSNNAKQETQKSTSTTSSIFLLDKAIPLDSAEMDLLNRAETYDVNGNVEKSMEYIRDLIKSFMLQDKQIPIINATMLLIEKMIMLSELEQATTLIRDIEHRINYYIVSNKSLTEELLLRIAVYKYLIVIFNQSQGKAIIISSIESLNQIINNPKNKEGKKTLMIAHYSLGLAYNSINNDKKSLQHYYMAAKIANNLFDFYFYFISSGDILNIFIKNQEYKKALNRLSILNQLFTNVKYSTYYKIKVFLYIAEVYFAQDKKLEAISILERSYELASINIDMGDSTKRQLVGDIKTKIQNMYSKLSKEDQAIKKEPFILYNFINNSAN